MKKSLFLKNVIFWIIAFYAGIIPFDAQASTQNLSVDFYNPYDVFTLSIRVRHDKSKCHLKRSEKHIVSAIRFAFTSPNDVLFDCWPESKNHIDILSEEEILFDIPLNACHGFFPGVDVDLKDYSMLVCFSEDRSQVPAFFPTSSSGMSPAEEEAEQYHPTEPGSDLSIPLETLLSEGYSIKRYCETIELRLKTKCPLEISETRPSYIGFPYRYTITATPDCDDPELVYSQAVFRWEYAHSKTNGFISLEKQGSPITVHLKDFPGAAMGDNIFLRISDGRGSSSANSKTLYFYPTIPQPVPTIQRLNHDQDYLRELSIQFDRDLDTSSQETIKLITIYDKVGQTSSGEIDLNESRIIYQQTTNLTSLSVNRTHCIPLPSVLKISEGKYYLTVEGVAMQKSNHPEKDGNENLPKEIRSAMFRCVPIEVQKKPFIVKNIEFFPPVCHGGYGKVRVTLNEIYPPTTKLPEFFHIRGNNDTVAVKFRCVSRGSANEMQSIFEYDSLREDALFLLAKYTLPFFSTGGYTPEKRYYVGLFSVDFHQPDPIGIPIRKKDVSGHYYRNGTRFPSDDGMVVIDRDNTTNGNPPYEYFYAKDNNPFFRLPVTEDTIYSPQGGVYRFVVEDAEGCENDTVVQVMELKKELQVRLNIQQEILCGNENGGSVKADIIKRCGDEISFAWFKNNQYLPGTYGSVLRDLGPGTYRVELSDRETGMVSSDYAVLTAPETLYIELQSISNVYCHGDRSGHINLIGKGGKPPYVYAWEDGAFGNVRKNLPAGDYTLTLIDDNGCSVQETFRVTQPEHPLSVIVDSIRPSHYDRTGRYVKGRVLFRCEGGTEPYETVQCCSGNHDVESLEPGKHVLFIRDSYGCPAQQEFTVPHYEKMQIAIEERQSVLCYGDSSASCLLTIRGGIPPYAVRWNTGDTSLWLQELGAGIYSVQVTDAVGAEARQEIRIEQPSEFLIDSTRVRQLSYSGCHDGFCPELSDNGRIDIYVSGGTPPYSGHWLKDGENFVPSDPFHLKNLSSGSYSVIISDANRCQHHLSFLLRKTESLKTDIEILKTIDCFGNETGMLLGTAQGGIPPYRFRWTGESSELQGNFLGKDSVCIENLGAGNYRLSVIDASEVESSVSIRLEQPPLLTITTESIRHPSYPGSKNGIINPLPPDGNIHLQVTGGTPPYSFSWSCETLGRILPDTNLLDSLPAGTYRLQISDSRSCRILDSIKLKHRDALFCRIRILDSVSCFGRSDGQLEAYAEGGVPPYRYQWFLKEEALSGETESRIASVPAGIYRISISDSLSVNSQYDILLSEPDSLEVRIKSIPGGCFGDSSGKFLAEVDGGTAPFRYHWEINGQARRESGASVSGIENATASVRISDRNSCTATAETFLLAPDSLIIEASCRNPSYSGTQWQLPVSEKNDGNIRLEIKGGTPPYRIRWNNGDTAAAIHSLPEGIYTADITDSRGCRGSKTIELQRTPTLVSSLNALQTISCYGDSSGIIELRLTGGIPPFRINWYKDRKWYGNDSTLMQSGLSAGVYMVEVRDLSGIVSTDSLVLEQPEKFTVRTIITNASAWSKKNGSIEIIPDGGNPPYSVRWPDGDTALSRTGLGRGVYPITITDRNLCRIESELSVSSPDSLYIEFSYIYHCDTTGNNGAIQVILHGGTKPYHFSWKNEKGDILCRDSSSNAEIRIENLEKGTYVLDVADNGGAQLNAAFIVKEAASLTAEIVIERQVNCPGEKNASLSSLIQGGTAPYAIRWEIYADSIKDFRPLAENQKSLSGIGSGIYRLQVQDASGSICLDTLCVEEPEKITINADILPSERNPENTCGRFFLQVEGGTPPYLYSWNTGNTSFYQEFDRENSYSVTVTDANGCTKEHSFDSLISENMEIRIIETRPIYCFGANEAGLTVEIQHGKPPFKIKWSSADTTASLSSLPEGNYSVSVTDRMGHTDSVSYFIAQPDKLENQIEVVHPSCYGSSDGKIMVTTVGGVYGYAYQWSNGVNENELNGLPEGTYVLHTTDGNRCLITDTVRITQPQKLESRLTMESPVCPDDLAYLECEAFGGTPPYLYEWSLEAENENPFLGESVVLGREAVLGSVKPGDYRLSIQDRNLCRFDTLIHIAKAPRLQYGLERQRSLCLGQEIVLGIADCHSTDSLQYRWLLPDGSVSTSSHILTSTPGLYLLELIQFQKCVYPDSVRIEGIQDSIHAEFWVSSSVQTNQNCLLVNLSRHTPDSIGWILPEEAHVKERQGNYMEISFSESGVFEVGTVSYKGECQTSMFKTIQVSDPKSADPVLLSRQDFIRWNIVPNPSSGRCVLYGSASAQGEQTTQVRYHLFRAENGRMIESGIFKINRGQNMETPLFLQPSVPGLYILLLEYGRERKSFKIIRL